jgi:hypothetical protein
MGLDKSKTSSFVHPLEVMAKVLLSIPEEYAGDVIEVIEAGLDALGREVQGEVAERLRDWSESEREYMERVDE